MQENPFFESNSLFDQALPFDKIKLSHFEPALRKAIEIAKKNMDDICNSKEPPGFLNTIVALETVSEKMDQISLTFSNLEVANGDDEFHKLAQVLYPLVSAFSSDVTLNPVLFEKVKKVYETYKANNLNEKLNPEQIQLLEKTYLSFVRNGALLDKTQKERIREIDLSLSILGPKFSENVLKSTNRFELIVSKEDLAGLPESAVDAAKEAAEKKGLKDSFLFNLQGPSYIPFITYSEKRDLREKIYLAFNSRAFNDDFDNQNNIQQILKLKNERAKILGFESHAEFTLKERMAESAKRVSAFLNKLLSVSKKAALKDYQEVAQFAKDTDNLIDLKPWDFGYYSEKLKEKKYSFNEEELRPYFKLENVVNGVFEHAKKLYGLVFKENSQIPVYHPDVKAYEIYQDQKYMGLFYTDFFPRETKKSGAWMTWYREQGLMENKVRRPHVSIVCNFTKPTALKPSLLSFDEVNTLFHEFGHALHGILSECQFRSLSGPNVYWDFVELPSQIMENWVTEKESLDLYAKHFETGSPIPRDLVDKLLRSQKFLSGWTSLRQIQFGLLDLALHNTPPEKITNVDEFETQVTADCRILPKIKGTNTSCGFSHIFAGGYSAGYYSYKWAEVLDADAFEFFKEKGIFNSEIASQFRTHILSKGGTEHPMVLYKNFRGREPDPEALLRRDGLLES